MSHVDTRGYTGQLAGTSRLGKRSFEDDTDRYSIESRRTTAACGGNGPLRDPMSGGTSTHITAGGAAGSSPEEVVFLLDCDNTLLDNDRVEDDFRDHLTLEFGAESGDRYWAIFEQLRAELGYADYLGALQRYRLEDVNDPRLLLLSSYLIEYPFADRLYPGALDIIRQLQTRGPTVILSDGDAVFQPRKIQRSGLWTAVGGRVLIYLHKEQTLDAVAAWYPARHYVMVDDKLRILTATKQHWQDRVTTIFPRQGHYARDDRKVVTYPAADLTVERIGDLAGYDVAALAGGVVAERQR